MSVKLKWFTTASIALESDGQTILFDPFIPFIGSECAIELKEYSEYDDVFVTHGHFDHILSIPDLYNVNNNIKIYCTKTPKRSLIKCGVDSNNIVDIKPNDKCEINGFNIEVFQSSHVKFNFKLVVDTMFSSDVLKHFSNIKKIVEVNHEFPENLEIVAYKVSINNVSILVLGSLGLDENVVYPKCDYLILPYQGNTKLPIIAKKIIDRLQPKTVIVDHFDNSFPPMSKHIDTTDLEMMLKDCGIKLITLKNRDEIELI